MPLKNFIFSLAIVLSISSCKKSGNEPDNKPDAPVNPNVDIYLGGRLGNNAAYWKNDVANTVNDKDNSSAATSIAVQGTDVYLAGYSVNPSGEKIITYWKNGVPTYLKNLGSSTADGATGIAVRGNDVYVIGRTARILNGLQTYSATLWKNGIASYISDAEDSFAYAITITISGDVYIGGRNERRACYWKNGVLVYAGEKDRDSWAFAICVFGSDVYTAGYLYEGLSAVNDAPVYWKNDIITKLPFFEGLQEFRVAGIAVNGSGVYVVGGGTHLGPPISYTKALYWKNGAVNDISTTNNQTIQYSANAVAIDGTDVYIVASALGRGYFLKNGTQVLLNGATAVNADFKAIAAVPK